MACIKCGGDMIGDGYTSVLQCEFLDGDTDANYAAPDEGPFYCDFPNNYSEWDEDAPSEEEEEPNG